MTIKLYVGQCYEMFVFTRALLCDVDSYNGKRRYLVFPLYRTKKIEIRLKSVLVKTLQKYHINIKLHVSNICQSLLRSEMTSAGYCIL